MGATFFGVGAVFFWFVAYSGALLGIDFTSAEMAEGYGYAIGLMIFGLGIRQLSRG